MAILLIAEHDNQSLKAATLNTLGAARRLEGEIHVLVAGAGLTVAALAFTLWLVSRSSPRSAPAY